MEALRELQENHVELYFVAVCAVAKRERKQAPQDVVQLLTLASQQLEAAATLQGLLQVLGKRWPVSGANDFDERELQKAAADVGRWLNCKAYDLSTSVEEAGLFELDCARRGVSLDMALYARAADKVKKWITDEAFNVEYPKQAHELLKRFCSDLLRVVPFACMTRSDAGYSGQFWMQGTPIV